MSSPGTTSTPVRAWLLTGPPGIGKSTLVSKVVYLLRSRGVGVGGCLTKERRSGRERVGFMILDLMSGREAELASSSTSLGPKVGRYRVNLRGLAEVGATALRDAAKSADVIIIDEVGPMELTGPEFKKGVEACIASGKPLLAVVHEMMKDPIIEQFRSMADKTIIEVTLHNREGLTASLVEQIFSALPDEAKQSLPSGE
ncbi:MAG: NTPase [Thaumarchaeota archaeon]|nr:NTPase [Nitrososphaerota archaeon]